MGPLKCTYLFTPEVPTAGSIGLVSKAERFLNLRSMKVYNVAICLEVLNYTVGF